MDKSEKDAHSENMFKGLRLLGEESKKREVHRFYKRCKSYYDEVYQRWRDVVKSYLEYLQMHKNGLLGIMN